MSKASGVVGLDWLTDLCHSVIRERKYRKIGGEAYVFLFIGKGDPLECGSRRAIKLLEHGMKVFERVHEIKIREQVKLTICRLDSHMAKLQQMPCT